jgi:hypothetical protein
VHLHPRFLKKFFAHFRLSLPSRFGDLGPDQIAGLSAVSCLMTSGDDVFRLWIAAVVLKAAATSGAYWLPQVPGSIIDQS